MIIDELEPPIPTAEEMEEAARRERERTAIYRLFGAAYYEDVYKLNEWMTRLAFKQAKEEVAKKHPDWAQKWPELFNLKTDQ